MNVKITDSIIVPKGFKATGAHIGLKKQKKDLSLIASDYPCEAAGCYTLNAVKAAPVLWDKQITGAGATVRGIATNSGNANACTGRRGVEDAEKMAETFAYGIGCKKEEILVCSTGVIGVYLPIQKIVTGISQNSSLMGYGKDDFLLASEAVMTTDTFVKTASAEIYADGKKVTLFGMAKGSGMIHPNMATMLSYIVTDCAVSKPALEKMLSDCVKETFNMISVDSDTSTNDTVLLLANGAAGNSRIACDDKTGDYGLFKSALYEITKKLATDVARDGEGATKLMQVNVSGAQTDLSARKIAKSVTASNLFKAALFGCDANWGRIVCAIGYSGGDFNPETVDISVKSDKGRVDLCRHGLPVGFDEGAAKEILSQSTVHIDINLNQGDFGAAAWGCDLTYDYVKINGDYRS